MYKRDIYLDIDDKLNEHIKSVELDSNSRVWHFHLMVDYEPLDLTGKSVHFRAEKPDKTNVLNDCKIVDAENGIVEVELTRQVNAVPGHVKCLLKIIGDEDFVLKTKTFVVDVSKTLSDDAVVSSDEFGALEVALGKVQDIDNRFAQTNAQLSNVNCSLITTSDNLSDEFEFFLKNSEDFTTLYLGKNRIYNLTKPLVINKPICINLNNSTIRGIGIETLFDLKSNNITIENGILDLTGTSNNGVRNLDYGKRLMNIEIRNITVKNINQSCSDQNGGVYLVNCKQVNIDACSFYNIANHLFNNNSYSPAIKLVDCEVNHVSNCFVNECGQGLNMYNSTNVYIDNIDMSDIYDNGYYILENSNNIKISNSTIKNVEEGVVIKNTSDENAVVSLLNISFFNATNKAISLRQGKMITIDGCKFINCNCSIGVGQDGEEDVKVNHITIVNNILDGINSTRAIYLRKNLRVVMLGNMITGFNQNGSIGIRVELCENVSIMNNTIVGNGENLENAISLTDSNCVRIYDNSFSKTTGNEVNIVNEGIDNIVINRSEFYNQNITVKSTSGINCPVVKLESKNKSVTQNDSIGKFVVASNDTSGIGGGDKYVVDVIATGSNGNEHSVEYRVDNNLFMRAFTNGSASIVLPTRDTNVPVGGLWNNNGVLAIKS